MNQERKPNFIVIEGGRDEMERKFIELLFKPYVLPRDEYLRQLAELEPSASRANLALVHKDPR